MNRKISVIGLGYVGLPLAVAFGNNSAVFVLKDNIKIKFLCFVLDLNDVI